MLFFFSPWGSFAIFFPLPLPRLFFVGIEAVFFFSTLVLSSVTAAGSYPFVLGLMAGLRCCASHGRIISIKGLAVNSGSPWILQAPNLHFSDAVVKARLAEGWTHSPPLVWPSFSILKATRYVGRRLEFFSGYSSLRASLTTSSHSAFFTSPQAFRSTARAKRSCPAQKHGLFCSL